MLMQRPWAQKAWKFFQLIGNITEIAIATVTVVPSFKM